MTIDLQAGDYFFTRGSGFLGAAIRGVEWLHSRDNEASYGHAGIITSPEGATLEALWTVERSTLACYQGQRILIARPMATLDGIPIAPEAKQVAIKALRREHLGQPYPAFRLPLFLFPTLAKFVASGHHVVCSELVAKYLALINARTLPYMGVNPDTAADEARRWRNIEVLYEGEQPATAKPISRGGHNDDADDDGVDDGPGGKRPGHGGGSTKKGGGNLGL